MNTSKIIHEFNSDFSFIQCHIIVYQEQYLFFNPENPYDKIIKNGLITWQGEIRINIKLSDGPFLNENDFKLLKISSKNYFDIGQFSPEFSGDALARVIIKKWPVIIKFQGSGPLKHNNENVTTPQD